MLKCNQIMASGAAFALAVGVAFGCSDDENGNGNGTAGGGGGGIGGGGGYDSSSSLTVSGAVEGDFSGYATYTDSSLESDSFSLSLSDLHQTYNVNLSIPIEDQTPPPVGTYDVGASSTKGEQFSARFEDYEVEDSLKTTYSPDRDDPVGTVELTSSSATSVEGTFEFEAIHDDFENDDEVTVTNGEFQAAQVEGGM